MDSVRQTAECILDISENIFQINEKLNPKTIITNKIFVIGEEEITIEKSDVEDSFYYFEHPKIDGVIIKKENNIGFEIKATVSYINREGKNWGFAKIRINNDYGEIHIGGRRTGSWEMPDFDDDDFIKNPDPELFLVLDSMKNSLHNIYQELSSKNKNSNDRYTSKWVKRLQKYNN